MSQFDAERVIQNIVGELVHECTRRRRVLTETLVAFMVKAVMLDPTNGFDVDRKLTDQDTEKLKELCLKKLLVKCSPSLDSINMQLYFHMNYTSQRDFLKEIHVGLDSRLSLLSRQITDSRVKTSQDSEAVYSRIISYILLQSFMGSPTDVDEKRDAEAALQSIFPQSELRSFMMLPKTKKEEQLRKLAMIATGIRLVNKVNGNREFDVQELMPAVLKDALSSTGETIRKELSETQTLVWKFTAVLEKLTQRNSLSTVSEDAAILLKQALYNVRVHEGFLKILLTDACSCEKVVKLLQTDLSSQLKSLRETLKPSEAPPAARVISSFKAVSSTWSRLLDEAELLKFLHTITVNLHPFVASQAEVFSEAHLDGLQEAAEVKSDEQRLAESSEQIDPARAESEEWLMPEAASSYSEVPLQYNGFCGYTLVNSDGLLLPGNPHIGVLKHEGKLYAFSSKEAALKFASSPDAFAAEVVEQAKRSPELIHLLNLHQQLSWIRPFTEVKRGDVLGKKSSFKCDSGTQTDIHPIETNIDKSYEWNEWELRRKALKLVNLRKKATHSCQTDKSHMRRENVTQTWLQKDAVCQTKKDGCSSATMPHIYLAGLTGQKEAHVVKVNLTKPGYEE